MKTQISRDSHRPYKNYLGVYQQQGRMLTDADWNELVTVINERITLALRDVVGGGIPHAQLPERWAGPDIPPMTVYAQGLGVQNHESVAYWGQPDFPGAPMADVSEDGILYADVWELPVLFLEDSGLRDPGLHGADTCTRTKVLLQLKRAPSGTQLLDPQVNPPRGDAVLSISLRGTQTEPGPDASRNLGDYLFRLEVHDVKGSPGAPTELTLKWSSENAAEAYANDEQVPQDFKGDDRVYEFYNATSERHLGVHLVSAPGFPVRSLLTSGYPAAPPDAAAWPYVRRWDGWCVLSRNESGVWSLVEGRDRGAVLTASAEPEQHGEVLLASSQLQMVLQELNLDLQWTSRRFVAGDYWLVTVREDHPAQAPLASNQTPSGILHRYVELGYFAVGYLFDRPDAKFPSLRELTSFGIDPDPHPGTYFIGGEAIVGSPLSLDTARLSEQLRQLLSHVNDRMGSSLHTASFQGVVLSGSGGSTPQRGDGIVVIRTVDTSQSTHYELRSNPSTQLMGRHGAGSFLAFRGNFTGIRLSGHHVYVMNGAATGTGNASGGFGFRVEHTGSVRRVLGVVMGTGGATLATTNVHANLSDGPHDFRAVHRGDRIQFFLDGVDCGFAAVGSMPETSTELYSVSLRNTNTQAAEVVLACLSVGNLRY